MPTEHKKWPSEWSWKELDAYITNERGNSYSSIHPLLTTIKEKPFTRDSLDQLLREGWDLRFVVCVNDGYCIHYRKRIILDRDLCSYQRDFTFFHELVHAWYGTAFSENSWDNPCQSPTLKNAVVEHTARQLRADPILLKKAVLKFKLTPFIYDRSSYLAFHRRKKNQLEFPFVREIEENMKTMMDY